MIPKLIKLPLKKIVQFVIRLRYAGNARHCPVCNLNSRKFGSVGIVSRDDAQCLFCGAYERHRLAWLYFKRKSNLFSGAPLKMLHIAPEPVFEQLFRKQLGKNYLTADLYNPRAMVKMDVTDIQFPDDSFDVIYCSHVLEHVQDDHKAMRELLRVLKPNGWAMLLVPIFGEHTFEDASITTPADRARVFGQVDHVRIYGRDYIDRLRSVGFEVEEVRPSDFLTNAEVIRMGITTAAGDLYLCKKRH